jgi:hypothetical protein
MGERDGIAIDEPRALWWWIDDSDSWERTDALRRMSPSAIDEGIDVTDESLRAVGEGSSVASGEMGLVDEDSLRDDFLVEKMEGFLPKMEALGAGDGSGAMLVLCSLTRPLDFQDWGQRCRRLTLNYSGVDPVCSLASSESRFVRESWSAVLRCNYLLPWERGSLLRHGTRLSRPAWRVKSPTRATKAKGYRSAWSMVLSLEPGCIMDGRCASRRPFPTANLHLPHHDSTLMLMLTLLRTLPSCATQTL